MWYIFLCSAFCVLGILGLTYLFERLWLIFYRPKDDPPHTEIIYLKKEIAVQQLKSAKENLKWEGNSRVNSVILIDLGIKDTEKQEILKIISNNKKIVFAPDSFKENLCGLF